MRRSDFVASIIAHPRSAQNIVPMKQVCTRVSANRPCALFTRIPLFTCAAPNACCLLLSMPCTLSVLHCAICVHSIHAEHASPSSAVYCYLRMMCIIGSTVDIVRQRQDALRPSKDHFGRSEKLPP